MGAGRKNKEAKRKRMESGQPQSDSMSSSPEYRDHSEVFDERGFWRFLKKNCDKVAEQILETRGWTDLTDQLEQQEEIIQELKEENMELRKRLAIAEGVTTRNKLAIGNIEEKMTEMTTRSMRDNIVIKNMTEDQDENETCIEKKALTFFEKDMKISAADMSKITIERAHSWQDIERQNKEYHHQVE